MLIVAAFAALYILWGSTYVAMHIVVHNGVTPFFTTGMRMAAAGGVMAVGLLVRGRAKIGVRDLIPLIGSGALLMVGGNALTMVASRSIPSGFIALLGATTPFWLAAGGRVLDDERLSASGIVGIIAGFSGVFILSRLQRVHVSARTRARRESGDVCVRQSDGRGCVGLDAVGRDDHLAHGDRGERDSGRRGVGQRRQSVTGSTPRRRGKCCLRGPTISCCRNRQSC